MRKALPLFLFPIILLSSPAFAATGCTLTSPAAKSILSASVSLLIACPSTVQQLNVRVGTSAYESDQPSNVASLNPKPAATLKLTVGAIPQNGSPIFVTLLSALAGNKWQPGVGYAFTEGTAAPVTTPALTLSSNTLGFGGISDGQDLQGDITLSSTGTAAVTITGITLTGSDEFSVSGVTVGSTLNPGATDSLDVTFGPTAVGAVTGSVTITSNAGTQTLVLTGTGTGAPGMLSSLSCSVASFVGLGGADTCTVGLTAPAGTGGLKVALSSSGTAVTVPASITVAAGASSVTFGATAATVTAATTVTLTAVAGTVTETFAISLAPPVPYHVALTWVAPTSSSDPVAGYLVYRTSGTGTYQALLLTPVPCCTYSDTTVADAVSYNYEVLSVDAKGNTSVPSNVYTAAIP